jgi:hypothetical protein
MNYAHSLLKLEVRLVPPIGDEEARAEHSDARRVISNNRAYAIYAVFICHICCEVLADEHVKQKEALRIARKFSRKGRRNHHDFFFASLRFCARFLSRMRRAGVFDVTPDPPRDEERTCNTNQKIEPVKPGLQRVVLVPLLAELLTHIR